ncbi:unnamed protein product [Larinioides sclopetarius]|uniref:Uncharacterized protein n=1 Tax=Larinioides sclopetarius TaxID=280406 RepID=A0AAV2B063_9ARAC
MDFFHFNLVFRHFDYLDILSLLTVSNHLAKWYLNQRKI